MFNNQPTHGLGCSASLRKMQCAHCGADVLYLFCDCDCRVLLDCAAGAWQVHACRPGLNRFSARDAFRIGCRLHRRMDALDARPEGGIRIGKDAVNPAPEFEQVPPAPAAWRDGEVRPTVLSFEVCLTEGNEER